MANRMNLIDPAIRDKIEPLVRAGVDAKTIYRRGIAAESTVRKYARLLDWPLVKVKCGPKGTFVRPPKPAHKVIQKSLVADPAREFRAKAAQLRWPTLW